MFEVSSYDGTNVQTSRLMPLAEAKAIDLAGYDCVLAPCFGRNGYRDPETKEWVEFGRGPRSGRRIGVVGMEILVPLQNSPGVYMDHEILYELTEVEGLLDPGIFPTYVFRLRDAYGERKLKGTVRFILTEGNCVAWSPERTWIRVVPFVKKPGNGSSTASDAHNTKSGGTSNGTRQAAR